MNQPEQAPRTPEDHVIMAVDYMSDYLQSIYAVTSFVRETKMHAIKFGQGMHATPRHDAIRRLFANKTRFDKTGLKIFWGADFECDPDQMRSIVTDVAETMQPHYLSINMGSDEEALRSAVESAGDQMKLVGTTLSSTRDRRNFKNRFGIFAEDVIFSHAQTAQELGFHALMCPPDMIEELQSDDSTKETVKIVEGIRLEGQEHNDHHIVGSLSEIMPHIGSGYVLLGRAILHGNIERNWEQARQEILDSGQTV